MVRPGLLDGGERETKAIVMFRRKTVLTQSLSEEKTVYECLSKLITAQTRATEQQLRWAKTEDNPLFLCLFGRLAELSWMGNELLRQFQEKQSEFSRAFRDIHQEEKIVDESRKALQACETKYSKLQKQAESAKKKNDTAKIQSLEVELTTQGSLFEHLTESVETQSQKLELYKVDLLKKGLQSQAEMYLDLTLKYQALFNAQLQLATLLPMPSPPSPHPCGKETRDIPEEMKRILSQVSESLELYPPTNGGVNMKRLSESAPSPTSCRRSVVEIDLHMKKLKNQHSISAPILVGHSSRPEDANQPQAAPRPLPKEPSLQDMGTSGEYCEIDIITGQSDEEQKYMQARKNVGVRRTQSGSPGSSPLMGYQRRWQNKHLSSADEYNHYKGSMDSILDEEDETSGSATGGSSSSSEDLNNDSKVRGLPHPGSQGSDECYADPVDAIHNYLHSGLPGPQQRAGSSDVLESPNAVFSPVTPTGEELHIQQSKEAQLQQFHDRLHKDSSSSDLEALQRASGQNGSSGEVDSDPTYSRPFDALMGNTEPLRVTAEKTKKNVNVSPTGWQRGSGGKSPPPPPVPAREEKMVVSRKPTRYARVSNGENEGGSPSCVSPVQPPPWDRREPVWKRQTNREECVSPTQQMAGEKPQPPPSIAERLRQLRQRSQSDGLALDEVRVNSRPPMPLPIPEQTAVEFAVQVQSKMNGHSPNGGGEGRKVAPVEQEGSKRKKAWLERTNSDLSDDKIRSKSVVLAKRTHAEVLPLSAAEIVQKHMSNMP